MAKRGTASAKVVVVVLSGVIAGWHLRDFIIGLLAESDLFRDIRDEFFFAGYSRLANVWVRIVLNMMDWLPAALLGVIVGLLWPRRWLWLALLAAVCQALTVNVRTFVWGIHAFQFYHWSTVSALESMARQAVSLPIVLLIAWAVSRLRMPYVKGTCRRCGYDLTGNACGICPECGTPVDADR
jgi:hypothetical protein